MRDSAKPEKEQGKNQNHMVPTPGLRAKTHQTESLTRDHKVAVEDSQRMWWGFFDAF